MKSNLFFVTIFASLASWAAPTVEPVENLYWMKVKATTVQERTAISNTGAVIESVMPDYVTAIAKIDEVTAIEASFEVETSFLMTSDMRDFPAGDERFHNFKELTVAMQDLQAKHANLIELSSMGKSLEGRELYVLTVTNKKNRRHMADLPAILFVGTHHAREHLSTEMPIMFAQHLAEQYDKKDARITKLVDNRVIYIVPNLNPDGSEFDIETGNYRMWRKNRRQNSNGSYGVDLNRNYGFKWGGPGASGSPSSDTFHGVAPFSEPETLAMKNFVEAHSHITTMLSFHTFSKLILYPWGYVNSSVEKENDRKVFETMGQAMAKWNGYTPERGSDLYLVSGESDDWAYGARGIFAFTFELDPGSMWEGGFYPGQSYIDPVFNKNLEPMLYLTEYADNPYRVIKSEAQNMGLKTPLF